jgi:hypothetical protein
MAFSKDQEQYIEELAFGSVDTSMALGIFNKIFRNCNSLSDYIGGLTLLGYGTGQPDLRNVCEFLQTCLSSPYVDVRRTACVLVIPRYLKKSLKLREVLAQQIKTISTTDLDSGVKNAASFALSFIE